ncbi:MAG: mercury resistance system transport protein MerF [Alphaproteobacteria bacterium]|nr:MAG: mercury resistance system transport protein MerF [Alphaproteobacteria bacterium]
MKDRTILRTGIAGTVIAAICCFTPVLVIALGAVGLSAWLGWLDYVLLPALAVFIVLTVYGLWRRQRSRQADCCGTANAKRTDQSS